MPTTQTIPIDLNTRGAAPVAFTHQGDTARTFAFEVYNDGEAFTLTGYTAKIGAILPADKGYTVIAGNNMATGSISGNTITATLPAAYTAKAGHGLLTIILTGSGGTLRPINIDLRIQKSADGPDVIEGASDFPAVLEEIAESVFQEYLNTYLPPVAPSASAAANKTADAKLTGEALEDLKSDLNYKADLPTYEETVSYTKELSKLINGSGSVISLYNPDNKWRVTGYIPVNEGERYHIKAQANNNYSFYAVYDSSYNAIYNLKASASETPNNYEGVIQIPTNGAYLCVAYYVPQNGYDTEVKIVKTESINLSDVNVLKSINLSDVNVLNGNYEYKTQEIEITLDTNKAINKTTGDITSPGNPKWAVSNAISVAEGESYIIDLTMWYNNGVIAIYDANDAVIEIITSTAGTNIGNSTYVFSDFTFTIPSNAAKMVIGVYTDYQYSCKKITGYQLIAKTYPWIGKKWACVGDSLTAVNTRATKHYFDYISEETGITPVNLGISGTGYMKPYNDGLPFYQRVDTIPTDSDLITIFGSGNDLSLTLGNVTDTGTDTICGCINNTIDGIRDRIVGANIGIITPTPWVGYPTYNVGNSMDLYTNAIVEICKRKGVPCLDLYHCSNMLPWEQSFREKYYKHDDGNGVHPDEDGQLFFAPRIKAFIESLLM